MKIGDEVRADGEKVIVLDIQKNYLILFAKFRKQFIKVEGWHQAYEIVSWITKKYYSNLDELTNDLE